MSVQIQRHHADAGTGQTTGGLDTGADNDRHTVTAANLKGRAQIARKDTGWGLRLCIRKLR